MTGMETHANVIETIWDQNFIHRAPLSFNLFIISALGIVCLLLIILFPKGIGQVIGCVLLMFGTVVALSVLLLGKANYWLEMVPLMAVVNFHFPAGMFYQRYLLKPTKEPPRTNVFTVRFPSSG